MNEYADVPALLATTRAILITKTAELRGNDCRCCGRPAFIDITLRRGAGSSQQISLCVDHADVLDGGLHSAIYAPRGAA